VSRMRRLAFYLWMPLCGCVTCAWFREDVPARAYDESMVHR
jgi:hypothetical protein